MLRHWRRCTSVAAVAAITASNLGCNGKAPTAPSIATVPQAVVPVQDTDQLLRSFTDPSSGLSATDVRDFRDQVVQFGTRGELIWTADGRRLLGFFSTAGSAYIDGFAASGNWFLVRFGQKDGDRRAYLTAIDDEGLNPGTLVDLDVDGSKLVVRRTNVFPPGTYAASGYTLSGMVSEATTTGLIPIEGAFVMLTYGAGNDYQRATTDSDGRFEIRGLYDGVKDVDVYRDGYEFLSQPMSIEGNTRVDLRLVRR